MIAAAVIGTAAPLMVFTAGRQTALRPIYQPASHDLSRLIDRRTPAPTADPSALCLLTSVMFKNDRYDIMTSLTYRHPSG